MKTTTGIHREDSPLVRSKLTNIDIAIYALYRLGGTERWVHTENVARECYILAPDRFSWELYPEYPAREPGRSALFDARKPKHGALVNGSKVTDEVIYLSAMDEGRYTIAQANAALDKNGRLVEDLISCRQGGEYIVARPEDIDRRLLARELPASAPKKIMAFEAKTGRLLWRKNDHQTVGLVSMSTAVKDGYLVFQNAHQVVCLDTANGAQRWQTKRQTLQARPVWATATLVITDDVVLSADYCAMGLQVNSSNKRGRKQDAKTTAPDAAKKRASELIAYDLTNGRPLWSAPCEDGSHVPNEIFVVDDLV
ncbi:MAG: hypothetical protein CEE40_11935, partial [Chloroflexi bacterium B3_Chlor]